MDVRLHARWFSDRQDRHPLPTWEPRELSEPERLATLARWSGPTFRNSAVRNSERILADVDGAEHGGWDAKQSEYIEL
jgi:hypothetical protein